MDAPPPTLPPPNPLSSGSPKIGSANEDKGTSSTAESSCPLSLFFLFSALRRRDPHRDRTHEPFRRVMWLAPVSPDLAPCPAPVNSPQGTVRAYPPSPAPFPFARTSIPLAGRGALQVIFGNRGAILAVPTLLGFERLVCQVAFSVNSFSGLRIPSK